MAETLRVPGLVLTEHEFDVPLDHDRPDGDRITVFAREVADPDGRDRPFLVFLQGGPGFEAPRPTGVPSGPAWLARALRDFRVLMLDQRGTGRSTPVGLLPGMSAREQADYLTHFRADSIVRDAEFVRGALGVERWSVLGQSFGGFCTLNYLSSAPHGLREAFFTGGVPPIGTHPDEVYATTYATMLERNRRYYQRFPGDRDRVRALHARLDAGEVLLPNGSPLTGRLFRQVGIILGMSDDVVIATHGRGFYVLDDGAALLRRLTPRTTPDDIADFRQTVPPVTPIPPVAPPPPVVPPTTPDPDAENGLAILRDPANPVRSVSGTVAINVTLKQNVASAAVTILDPQGKLVRTIPLPTTAGAHNAVWNLRWPDAASFPGLIYWIGSNQGPKADLGAYTAQLTVDGQPLTQSFEVLKDSRLTNVTAADIHAQFELDLAVRDRTTDANTGVSNIRSCTAQVADRVARAGDPAVTEAGTALSGALSTVENELYQTRLRSAQDPLNFPIKLNNKIAHLHGVIESVDARPTDQTVEVFDLLSGKLQDQLDRLDEIVGADVPAFNELVAGAGLPPVTCAAVPLDQ